MYPIIYIWFQTARLQGNENKYEEKVCVSDLERLRSKNNNEGKVCKSMIAGMISGGGCCGKVRIVMSKSLFF